MITKRNLPELFVVFILLLFVLLKIPALHLPYFWDELGVYSRAGLYLHDNGLGLLPKDLPPELSRGHPLLFAFIQAIGYNIFGDGVVGGHITALIISLILLWSVYFITSKYFSKYTALLAVMILIIQPLFFAQSVLILPEISLALFVLWAIYFWLGKKYILHGIFSTLAILIKETAIIIPVVIIFSELIYYIVVKSKREKIIFRFKYLWVLLPFLVFGIFLLIQKQQNGWYLFPLHGDNIKISLNRIFSFGADYLVFLFLEQGRILLTGVIFILVILLITSKKMVFQRISIFLITLIMGGLAFNSINFYMNRYTLFVLVPFVMLSSAVIMQCIQKYRFVLLILPIIFFAGIYCMYGKELWPEDTSSLNMQQKFHYDENMSYVDFLDIQQKAIDHVMNNVGSNEFIYANFPINVALVDSRFGYTLLVENKDFRVLNHQNTQYEIKYSLISDPGSYEYELPDSNSIVLDKLVENNVVNVKIYRPK